METICTYILLFYIYSFLGWCMETILVSIENKRFINRGFLIGPYCPIYGLGSIFIIAFLMKFSNNMPILLFFLILVICGALEYFTSWIMEKLFKARWWDYSHKKFNLNGRICLENLIEFGILGLIVAYALNPFFEGILQKLQSFQLECIAVGLTCIYLIDVVISFVVIFGFRNVTKTVNSEGKADNTEQITKMVRELFSQKSFLHKRFINAYPRLQAIQIKIEKIKNKIDDVKVEAKEAVEEKKEEIKNSIEQSTRKAKVTIYLSKKHLKSNFKGKNINFKKKEE